VRMHNLNLLAVLVAAVSTMVVGFLWYSPILFAKPWMREMGYDPDDKAKVQEMQKSAGLAYLGSFIVSLVSAFPNSTTALIAPNPGTAVAIDGSSIPNPGGQPRVIALV